MGAGGSSQVAPVEGSSKGKQPATAVAATPAEKNEVMNFLSGYDSDIENQLGRKFAGRREVVQRADGGGQFLAVKPWAGAIFPPQGAAEADTTAPPTELVLDTVFGYRGHDSSDNAWYLASGEVVYPAAGTCVVFDREHRTQRVFFGHTDDVTCLAVHPNGKIVASGQVGHDPAVLLWDPASLNTIGKIHGCFERAVTCVAFTSDGSRIVSADLSEKHALTVHEVKGEAIAKIASKETGGNPIQQIRCHPRDPGKFVTIAKEELYFWEVAGAELKSKKGLVGTVAPLQPLLSVDYLPDGSVIAGTASGHVYVWPASSQSLSKAVQAHQSSVFVAHAAGSTVWTAGKDGKLRAWDATLSKQTKMLDLRTVLTGLVDAMGRSLLASNSGKSPLVKTLRCVAPGKLLIGLATCELLEIDEATGVPTLITQGHYKGEIWGLSAHPKKLEFATASEDRTLRTWSVQKRALLSIRGLPQPASAVGYSPDGSLIAVGFVDGSWSVVKSDTLQDVHTCKQRKERISQVKFSPNGRMLAVGSHDNFVDLYDVEREFRLICTTTGHHSFITHIDWSANSEYLRTNSGDYELLFWRSRNGEQVKEAKKMADISWASHTVVLAWDAQGIWQRNADGTDVNSVDRSRLGDLLVTGDDFGFVNVFRYPVPKPGAESKRFGGHSAHVTNTRFSFDDHWLISTGGGDETVFLWRVKTEGEAEEAAEAEAQITYLDAKSFRRDLAIHTEVLPLESYEALPPGEGAPATSTGEAVEGGEPVEQGKPSLPGNWFMAVRPWLGAIFPPRVHPEISAEAPGVNLRLDWVYGFRGHDARENLSFLASGEIVYHAAGVGIVMDSSRRQRLFVGHTDDIVSLTVHPDGRTVATGQIGSDPQIIVWDSADLKVLKVLNGFHQRAVTSLGFSPDGKLLTSVGMDDYHSVAVWDWQAGHVVASARGSTDKVFDINFHPNDPTQIVSCGVKHIRFWTLAGSSLKAARGLVKEKGGKIQTMNCMAFPAPGVTLIGTQGGEVYVFVNSKLANVVAGAHAKGITAIWASQEEHVVITGGGDGKLRLWGWDGATLSPTAEIPLKPPTAVSTDKALRPRSIAKREGQVVVGTITGEVVSVDLASKQLSVLAQGQSDGEVWGLAVSSKQPLFATACDDTTVRVWDYSRHEQVAIRSFGQPACSADFSPDGSLLAVGFAGGNIVVVQTNDLKEVFAARDRKEPVFVVRFSPAGDKLAVGSHDNFIDVYNVPGGKRLGTLAGHNSFITHLDWSLDGKYIQSNCGAYELLFWDVEAFRQIVRPSKLADTEWATFTCVLGWPVQGIWPPGANGTDINMVARSHSKDLLASADDFGLLKLFKYPSVQPGSRFKKFLGHSSHVTNVVWLPGDAGLLTTGGADRCIFQWSVTK